MVLQILLIASIVLQIIAAGTAISLTRVTKYNLSWILFTIAFTALSFVRLGEYIQLVGGKELRMPPDFFVWLGVVISLSLAIGVFYVRKIFNYIQNLDFQRRLTEKRILNTVLRTEEKERIRFAKEIHDGLGPLLSSAKMSLSALSLSDQNQRNTEIIRNTNYVIEEAIRSVREISNNLSPHILQDFGLVRAINNYISKSLALNNIPISFNTNLRAERFDTDVEVIVYRVICELINNSVRHSGASQIMLTLLYESGELIIDYSDNGCGFIPEAVKDVGMGLSNIVSRVNSIKGHTEISSSRSNGMRANIRIDLKNPGTGFRKDQRRKTLKN